MKMNFEVKIVIFPKIYHKNTLERFFLTNALIILISLKLLRQGLKVYIERQIPSQE